MSRTVPEWRGTTDDAAIPPRVKLRIFERYGRCCACGCGRKITVGELWHCDHIVALCNGGEHRELNLRPLLIEHHKRKTADDIAIRSYHYKRRLAAAGIKRKRRPMPGSRDSAWKITFSRGVIRR